MAGWLRSRYFHCSSILEVLIHSEECVIQLNVLLKMSTGEFKDLVPSSQSEPCAFVCRDVFFFSSSSISSVSPINPQEFIYCTVDCKSGEWS